MKGVFSVWVSLVVLALGGGLLSCKGFEPAKTDAGTTDLAEAGPGVDAIAPPATGGTTGVGGAAGAGGVAPGTGGVAPGTGGVAPGTGGSAPGTGGAAGLPAA